MEEKKKKKAYVKPEMRIEEFTPNEYVGACWGVACVGETANQWEKDNNNWYASAVNHNGSCKSVENQYLIDNNNDGVPEGMYEKSSDQGRLDCTIYTDDKYSTTRPASEVKIGEYIYWTTSNPNYTWHHQGIVINNGSNNHS